MHVLMYGGQRGDIHVDVISDAQDVEVGPKLGGQLLETRGLQFAASWAWVTWAAVPRIAKRVGELGARAPADSIESIESIESRRPWVMEPWCSRPSGVGGEAITSGSVGTNSREAREGCRGL